MILWEEMVGPQGDCGSLSGMTKNVQIGKSEPSVCDFFYATPMMGLVIFTVEIEPHASQGWLWMC